MTFLSSIELGDSKNIYPRSVALLKKKLHVFGQADLGQMGLEKIAWPYGGAFCVQNLSQVHTTHLKLVFRAFAMIYVCNKEAISVDLMIFFCRGMPLLCVFPLKNLGFLKFSAPRIPRSTPKTRGFGGFFCKFGQLNIWDTPKSLAQKWGQAL
jgi:hypothetical protein